MQIGSIINDTQGHRETTKTAGKAAQVLGVLPYTVVLDRETKSVVLSIRGSASISDYFTDFMGIPEDMGTWIPDGFRQARRPPSRPSAVCNVNVNVDCSPPRNRKHKHFHLAYLLPYTSNMIK